MKTLLKGGTLFRDGVFFKGDVLLQDGIVVSIQPDLPDHSGDLVFFLAGCHLLPGLADIHVHLRQPGFSQKETIAAGTLAAARGGFTLVCPMPNLAPPPDSPENLQQELDIIARDAHVQTLPYACITHGRAGQTLVDMPALAPCVAGFSDDGSGVQNTDVMRRALQTARELDVLLCAHCEDDTLIPPGAAIHAGPYAAAHGLPGIPSESEWRPIERDIALVAETGARYHVCHVSTARSVALVRAAKAQGLPVSCEVAPHYLWFCQDDLVDDGRFKMNPPLRTAADRAALIAGLADGTIDVVATDHAPHTAAEKAGGLAGSAMGVVGLETSFAACYTNLVLGGHLTLEALIDRMSTAPRRLLGLPPVELREGAPLNATAVNLAASAPVDPAAFLSRGRSTPFAGLTLTGQVLLTFANGRPVWQAPGLPSNA